MCMHTSPQHNELVFLCYSSTKLYIMAYTLFSGRTPWQMNQRSFYWFWSILSWSCMFSSSLLLYFCYTRGAVTSLQSWPAHRHVAGTLCGNENWQMRKSDHSHVKVIKAPYISTAAYFYSQNFESIHKLTMLRCSNIVYLQHGGFYRCIEWRYWQSTYSSLMRRTPSKWP